MSPDALAAVEMWLANTNAPRHVLDAMGELRAAAPLVREVRDWFDNYVRRGIGAMEWVPQTMNDALCADYDARYPEPSINSFQTDSALIDGGAA